MWPFKLKCKRREKILSSRRRIPKGAFRPLIWLQRGNERKWLNQLLRDATNLRDHAYVLPTCAAIHGGKKKCTRKAGFCQIAVYFYIAWPCNQFKHVDSANCQPLLHKVPSEMLPVR